MESGFLTSYVMWRLLFKVFHLRHYSMTLYSLENQLLIYSASAGTSDLISLPEVLMQRS